MATTRYHDKEFDELLHARWSFVFDLLGIDWEYHWRDPAWLPSDDLAATFYLPSRRTWFRSEEPYGDPVGVEAWEEHMNALESDDPNDRFELDELYDDPVPPEWRSTSTCCACTGFRIRPQWNPTVRRTTTRTRC